MNPGLHGPERNAARFGNLPIGHTGDFLEHQSFPFVVGQTPKRRFQLGPAVDGFLRLDAFRFHPRICGRSRHFKEPPLPARPAERVVGRPNCDPAEPGSHRPVAPVAGCPAEGAQVSLLSGVFGFGPVPQDGEGNRTNAAFGTADEFIEGGKVSLFTESRKQPALFRTLPGAFLVTWIIRRVLWLLGRKTHRTGPFVRAGQECAAV